MMLSMIYSVSKWDIFGNQMGLLQLIVGARSFILKDDISFKFTYFILDQ